jgi:hypothetical protein
MALIFKKLAFIHPTLTRLSGATDGAEARYRRAVPSR